MRITYMSDLHLDFYFDGGASFLKDLTIPDCDLTVIAGDLSQANHWRWKQNIQEICNKSKQVLYVLGNHEVYGASLTETDCLAHGLAAKVPNLTVASRAKVLTSADLPCLGKLCVLAGTLWFPDASDHKYYKDLMNDFGYIEGLEPEIYCRNERFDVLLHGIKDEECIVVSHHLPSPRSVHPKYRRNSLNRFFVGFDNDEVIQDSQIKLWAHGHSHEPVDYKIGNTRIVSNPTGYPHEIAYNWEPKVIDI
jgi:predicted phosphodiesterase